MLNNPRDGAHQSPSETEFEVFEHLTLLTRQQWEGVLDCTQPGPMCMQYSFDSSMNMSIIGQVMKPWI